MPDKTRCIHCGKVGFVRWEHVIKGGSAYREFFCGHCQRSWRVAETDEVGRRDDGDDADDGPDRPRER